MRLDGKLAAIGVENEPRDVVFEGEMVISRVFEAIEGWKVSLSAVWEREM